MTGARLAGAAGGCLAVAVASLLAGCAVGYALAVHGPLEAAAVTLCAGMTIGVPVSHLWLDRPQR